MTIRAARDEGFARLLAHQQVDVALAVAELGVLETVERVGERAADLREQHELVDSERRLAALRLHRRARGAHDVAEVDVDRAGPILLAEELDPPGAVDEVEEDDLPHVAAGHDAARNAYRAVAGLAGLERLGGRAPGGHVVPIGKALRQAAHLHILPERPVRITTPRYVWIAAAAAVVGVHVLSRASTLTELDSTNLALALRDYDVRDDQPHAPGYPLVVAAAQLLGWLGEPVPAYLAFALLASVGAVTTTFLLGRELFDARAGAIAALLLVASPLFLYYASIVSVYPAEALFGPLVVLLAHRVARQADRWSVLALAPMLALAAGFRPTALGLLLPVCIVAVVLGRPRLRDLAIGAGVGVAIVAAWAVPMLRRERWYRWVSRREQPLQTALRKTPRSSTARRSAKRATTPSGQLPRCCSRRLRRSCCSRSRPPAARSR